MEKQLKIGITFSAFDLLHAGHIKMLEEAKSKCDYLICGLQTDPTLDRPSKNKPVQTVVERYLQLRACKYVDEIIPYATEQDLEDQIYGRSAGELKGQHLFDRSLYSNFLNYLSFLPLYPQQKGHLQPEQEYMSLLFPGWVLEILTHKPLHSVHLLEGGY